MGHLAHSIRPCGHAWNRTSYGKRHSDSPRRATAANGATRKTRTKQHSALQTSTTQNQLGGIPASAPTFNSFGWFADARAQQWALQAQINPHFFFNTLNTIAALIRPRPDAAERMVGLLADMSRYSFGTEERMVPLQAELDFAEKYLEIERERFGERLSWSLPPAEHARGLSLPPLTLQPLVENAVRHGVARQIKGGPISVALRRSQDRVVISVTNAVEETPSPDDLFRPGHALWNIRERLQLRYGGRASLAVTSDDTTFTVMISVPIEP